jgi:tRNA pseudouridine13 synthase
VIAFLKDHPHEYRKAANLIKDRLLAVYLSAYQAWIWNRIAGEYLKQQLEAPYEVEIARYRFPLPEPGPELAARVSMTVELPRLTARYEGDLERAAQAVFEDEELGIRDFKARILRRVYLVKGEREVVFVPGEVEVTAPSADERNPDRRRVTVGFTLDPGRYATLVLKAAAALIDAEICVR